jgi:hypothetical protein
MSHRDYGRYFNATQHIATICVKIIIACLFRLEANMKSVILISILLALLVLLTGCAPGPNDLEDTPRPERGYSAGFWLGLWHGTISPITFVISLFSDNVSVYEVHNTGGWYNIGFLLGLGGVWGGGGGGAAAARKGR